jgi:hypothetical protein
LLTIFTETKLQNDLMNLVTTYRNNGTVGVRITYELDKLDSNRINEIFKIKEGKTSKITNIRFIGNKNFSETELEQVMTYSVSYSELFLKAVKAAVFGAIISISICYYGYHCREGARGVGIATTSTVVLSSILIILANYMITLIYA